MPITRNRRILLMISQLAILAVMIATERLVYMTNDDPTMVALLCGGYGEPSQYVVNFHILLGYFLKGLFSLLPTFNWMTLLLVVTEMGAFWVLDWVFDQKIKNNLGFLAVSAILDWMLLIVLSYFTFTVAAYIAAIGGLAAVTAMLLKEIPASRKLWAASVVLMLMAMLIRAEVYKSLLIGYLPVMLWFGIKEKRFSVLAVGAVCLAVMQLSISSNTLWVEQDPVQEQFYEWGEKRSAALDCSIVPYSEELGLNFPQYMAIYLNFYYHYDAVDTAAMDILIEANGFSNKYNLNLAEFLANHYGHLADPMELENLYAYLFAAVVIVYLIFGRGKKDRILLLLLWGSALGCELVFHVIQRAPYRVVMPGYLFAVLLILLLCRLREDLHFSPKLCSGLKVAVIFVFCLGLLPWSRKDYREYGPERRQVLAYMEENNDKLFLAGGAEAFLLPKADYTWDCSELSNGWNLMGNWEIYSKPYMDFMEKRDIQNPYSLVESAIDNPDIMILTYWGDEYPERFQWTADLIQEYYNKSVELVKVDDIGPDCIEDQYWSAYKIVSK